MNTKKALLPQTYDELKRVNFYRLASPDWKRKNYIDTQTHKVTNDSSVLWSVPWDYINNDSKRQTLCRHAQDLFQMYALVPPFCVGCFKIVVKPERLSQLFLLRDLMYEMAEEDPTVWCKCGIEQRMYVPGLYGGYFYTDDRETWRKRYDEVRERVTQRIGDISVVMKRYCTEFEKELGDSIETEERQPEDAQRVQDFYFHHLDLEKEGLGYQPALVKLEVYQAWIDWGWKFGSEEDRKEIEDTYNSGKPLYPKPTTYERET